MMPMKNRGYGQCKKNYQDYIMNAYINIFNATAYVINCYEVKLMKVYVNMDDNEQDCIFFCLQRVHEWSMKWNKNAGTL